MNRTMATGLAQGRAQGQRDMISLDMEAYQTFVFGSKSCGGQQWPETKGLRTPKCPIRPFYESYKTVLRVLCDCVFPIHGLGWRSQDSLRFAPLLGKCSICKTPFRSPSISAPLLPLPLIFLNKLKRFNVFFFLLIHFVVYLPVTNDFLKR